MRVLAVLLVSTAAVNASPFIGSFITGLTNIGTELGKKTADIVSNTVDMGADALSNTATVGFNTGKLALAGIGGVSKQVLDTVGDVGHNAIDVLGIVGNSLGSLGQPVKLVEGLAHKALEKGVESGKNAIDVGENIGTKTMTVADKVVIITAGTGKNAATAGSDITKGSLEAIREGVTTFLE